MKKTIALFVAVILIHIIPVIAEPECTIGSTNFPTSFSWRNINGNDFTTSIKEQSPCPSCEAYALVAALETLIQYQVGYPFGCDLSEAHLFFYPGGTCNWGVNVSDAADYLVEYGVPDEGCFPDPHRPHDGPFESLSGWENRTVKIQEWGWVENDEEEIKQALIEHGPLTICIWVYEDFRKYRSGVYRHIWGEKVGGHLVCLVGYDDVEQCWIVKNSWGTDWGDDGWFKMAYDPDMFISGCYGGTGILYVDGVYGNFMPDVPKIYIDSPKIFHNYIFGFEFPTKYKYLPLLQAAAPRIIGKKIVKVNVSNANMVEFYLDGKLKYIDDEQPYEWRLRAFWGLHTVETIAYNEHNASKDIIDLYVFL